MNPPPWSRFVVRVAGLLMALAALPAAAHAITEYIRQFVLNSADYYFGYYWWHEFEQRVPERASVVQKAAGLTMLLGARRITRLLWRARRGRCGECGYDAGSAAKCPECGAPVEPLP
jgi:hypothetical protein